MARLSSRSPFLVTVETPRGGIVKAVRANGEIIARRPSGAGHRVSGRVKPELTPAHVLRAWERAYPTLAVSLTPAGREHGDRPIVTEAAARKRAAAKAAAAARASAERAAQESAEAEALAGGDAEILAYVTDSLRTRTRPINPFLAAVYEAARFHLGNGYLGSLIGASILAADDFRRAESLGEQIAQAATGSRVTPGVTAWGRVL